MTAYYNEIDPYAAAWLKNLIAAGHIAPGVVDTRSIVDVSPDDLLGYTQVHFFAGIGGWSLAARIAGWPDDKPLWTGSCPCQPFSAAGKRKGTEDARHLWPEMRRLIAACRPDVVAGEQVASADGRLWLAGVRADLEDMAYEPWAADLCAAGTGAPHIRQRIWWLADARSGGIRGRHEHRSDVGEESPLPGEVRQQWLRPDVGADGAVLRLGDSDVRLGRQGGEVTGGRAARGNALEGAGSCGTGDPGGLVHAEHARLEGHAGHGHNSGQSGWLNANTAGPITTPGDPSFWSTYSIVHCTDGKARRFEPGSFPLAHGVSNRVGRLRAYGNAINPWLAAEVLGAYLDGPSTNSSVTSA